MKLIVDANILFPLTTSSSYTSFIVNKYNLELFSVDYALLELEKYKEDIVKKSGQQFSEAMKILNEKVTFIPVKAIEKEIKECKSLILDQADVVYLALAKHLNIPLWSNDSHFKQQSLVSVITTKKLITLLPFD